MYKAAKHLQRQINPNCFTSFGSKENIQADFLNSRKYVSLTLRIFLNITSTNGILYFSVMLNKTCQIITKILNMIFPSRVTVTKD